MWVPTSSDQLEQVEKHVLAKVQSEYESQFVELENGETVRMIIVSPGKPGVPLVLLHGFGAAVGCWVKNLDALAENRTVYAIDQVGFGRSSRPSFSEAADEAEDQLVEGFELWRRAMNLESFILLGHSLGGYVSVSFSLRYPQYVQHLILVDPWGMPQRPENSDNNWPLPIRILRSIVVRFNLLAILRAAGPAGPRLFQRARSDIRETFSDYFPDSTMMDYLYHCNAQEASGEIAMKSLNEGFGWAVNPMLPRLGRLEKRIGLSFIYGEHSWMNPRTGCVAREQLGRDRVTVDMVPNATHHVFAQSDVFNWLVCHYCKRVETGVAGDRGLVGRYGESRYNIELPEDVEL